MKCNACPLHLVCISGTLDMSYGYTYVCCHCERFFTRAITLALGWPCFVCERRSAYVAEYKRMTNKYNKITTKYNKITNKCNKIIKNNIRAHKRIFSDMLSEDTCNTTVTTTTDMLNTGLWNLKTIIRDPVSPHKKLCIRLCDTCDKARLRRYTIYI